MVKLINSQDTKLNKEQTASITQGAEWVKNWYRQRKESGYFTELPENPEFEKVMNRAENVQVMVADDMYAALEQALERGDLHFKDSVLFMCGGYDKVMEAFKTLNQLKREKQSDEVIGGLSASKYITEPVVVLNQEVIKKLEPQEIESVTVHEITHAVEAETSEMMLAMIHEDMGSSNDEYVDNPREMYARLMQMRHHFNLAPDSECGKEDIARLREECAKRMDKFVKDNGADDEIPEYIDFMMFDRYSDEEIQKFLNYTSDNSIDREALTGDMQRDWELAQIKGRLSEKEGVSFEKRSKETLMADEKNSKETPTTEIDGRLISCLADKQYS